MVALVESIQGNSPDNLSLIAASDEMAGMTTGLAQSRAEDTEQQ
jgi:hypothetical protein